jgi:CheY-like chemotaxis protein
MSDSIDMYAQIAEPEPESDRPLGSVASLPVVLVCEDEALIRAYLVDLLEELGYSVLEAADGDGAIEQTSKTQIDLLITDLGLPDMPGIALAQRLRLRSPHLPVLLATGRDREDAGLLDGNTAYLAKPFTMPTLRAALSGLLASADGT